MTPDAAIQQISTALGVSWASGINLYATLLVMGIMHSAGMTTLPTGIDYVAHPMVMIAAGVMFAVEFFADKTPGVDSAWDGMHTFIRIPAAVAMAYGAADGMGPVIELSSALVGGGLAATSHATKSGTRLLINTSPEPFTNWFASITEDIVVIGGVWVALTHPFIFLCLLGLFILLAIWLLPKIWRTLKKIIGKIRGFFRRKDKNLKIEEGQNL